MNEWKPLSARLAGGDEYSVLQDGIPPGLRSSLTEWVFQRLLVQNRYGESLLSTTSMRRIERRLRTALDWSYGSSRTWDSLKGRMTASPEFFLDVIDFTLSELELDYTYAGEAVDELETCLREGGSVWAVGVHEGTARLEARVDAAVAGVVAEVANSQGQPGVYLGRAWSRLYRRAPELDAAYQDAVRAVEAAAQPFISPKNKRATLGTMISDIRKKPEKWLIQTSSSEVDGVGAVLSMMEVLWKGQHDRHGSSRTSVPLSVTVGEASLAVHLAAALVHIFISGLIGEARSAKAVNLR